MQALPSPSNFTATNLSCSSPIFTSPNHTTTNSPESSAESKSTMASSSLTVTEPTANKENICPLTILAADSGVSRKRRRRFVRKPLADITNQFESRNYSNDELFRNSRSTDCQKMSKRKAGMGDSGDDGVEVRLSCRLKTKTLTMSFR